MRYTVVVHTTREIKFDAESLAEAEAKRRRIYNANKATLSDPKNDKLVVDLWDGQEKIP